MSERGNIMEEKKEVTFEEAYEKAKALKPVITYCVEYKDFYSFCNDIDGNTDGGDGPCVIVKETGEAVNFLEVIRYQSPRIKRIDLKA